MRLSPGKALTLNRIDFTSSEAHVLVDIDIVRELGRRGPAIYRPRTYTRYRLPPSAARWQSHRSSAVSFNSRRREKKIFVLIKVAQRESWTFARRISSLLRLLISAGSLQPREVKFIRTSTKLVQSSICFLSSFLPSGRKEFAKTGLLFYAGSGWQFRVAVARSLHFCRVHF
jgi:hypothetical protein